MGNKVGTALGRSFRGPLGVKFKKQGSKCKWHTVRFLIIIVALSKLLSSSHVIAFNNSFPTCSLAGNLNLKSLGPDVHSGTPHHFLRLPTRFFKNIACIMR